MKIIKTVLLFSFAACSLVCCIITTIKYLSLESTIQGMKFPEPVTINKYNEMSDYERLNYAIGNIRFDVYHDSSITFQMFMILFFMVFCIFLYLGIINSVSKKGA